MQQTPKKFTGRIKQLKQEKSWFVVDLGIGLIVGSLILWGLLIPLYFLPISESWKVFGTACLLVLAEIAFWAGTLCVGKELAMQIRKIPSVGLWLEKLGIIKIDRNKTEKKAEVEKSGD